MSLLCGAETYDPDSLKEGLAANSIEARDFRNRFEAILKDQPLGAQEYERDIGFHFDTDEQLYSYLSAMHAFLFENGPFPV
jgi:hypothetical protein